MKSVGAMIKQLSGMLETADLNAWETGFVSNVATSTRDGQNTLSLTDAQVDKITSLYSKHFGDAA